MSEVLNQVPCVDNHVYFYLQVDPDTSCLLNCVLQEVACTILSSEELKDEPIILHINSPGGTLTDGFAVVDTIRGLPVPVTTVAEGRVASSAVNIFLAGNVRTMCKNAYMLIHELSHCVEGNFTELKESLINDVQFMNHIKQYLMRNSKLTKKDLEYYLSKDLMLNAKTCYKLGLTDEIL